MFDEKEYRRLSAGIQEIEPVEDDSAEPYSITVLQAPAGIRLGKTWQLGANGEPECTEAYGWHFDADTACFETFAALCRYLDGISKLNGACIVYGNLLNGKSAKDIPRRKHPRADGTDGTIIEARQRWLPIDFDWPNVDHEDDPFPTDTIDPALDPDAAIDWVIERLGEHHPEFRGASVRWQFTTKTGIRKSDGTLYKPGIYVRLYFPLDRAILNSEAGRWLQGVPGVDTSIYSWEHEIFTKTHFVGIADPLPQRIGYLKGVDVVVPEIRLTPPPLRLEPRRDVFQTEGNPVLIAEGYRIKDAHLDLKGEGTAKGNRAVNLITKLGQLRSVDDEVLIAEDIADILAPEYETPITDIERLLSGQMTRGYRLVEASTVGNEADEALEAEAEADDENIVPAYLSAQAASEQLARDLDYAIKTPGEHLIVYPAGLGKTTESLDIAIQTTCGLTPENLILGADDCMIRTPEEALMNLNLGLIPDDFRQAVFAVPRHALADELAKKTRKNSANIG